MRLPERILLWATTRSHRFYQHASFTVSLQCGQHKLRIPIIRGFGRELLSYRDERIQKVASSLFASGRRGLFVDIGANRGMMILNMLELNLGLPYLGFEPDLAAAHYTYELIRANHLRDHDILPIALGSQQTMATLHSSGPGDVSATLGLELRPQQMYSESARVAVSTADDQLAALDVPIFLVKIDAEGWELNILRGMERTLRDKRPPVYFEVMGYRHLIDSNYSRQYFGGELGKDERERLVQSRRSFMRSLQDFWHERGYTLSICRPDATLQVVDSLDPGPESEDNCGEMNFLALG